MSKNVHLKKTLSKIFTIKNYYDKFYCRKGRKKELKKVDQNGFTLIELLAVIVILAILMITAIPAVTNSIAKSRKDTFATNAKNIINAVRTSMASGEVVDYNGNECSYPSTGAKNKVAVVITTDNLPNLLERGGDKSSFGKPYYNRPGSNDHKTGYVIIENTGSGSNDKFKYSISLIDSGGNGIKMPVEEEKLNGNVIALGSITDGLPNEQTALGITGDENATTTKCYIN